MKVPAPVIAPRTRGFPRPVSSLVSDSPSEKLMLTPAGADRRREPREERVPRPVASQRHREDRG
jgi:hypothetical protein